MDGGNVSPYTCVLVLAPVSRVVLYAECDRPSSATGDVFAGTPRRCRTLWEVFKEARRDLGHFGIVSPSMSAGVLSTLDVLGKSSAGMSRCGIVYMSDECSPGTLGRCRESVVREIPCSVHACAVVVCSKTMQLRCRGAY